MDKINSLINSLTGEQEQQLITFRADWLRIGLSTNDADRPTAERAVAEMYRRIGKKPPQFWWCDSPMSVNLVINILNNMDYKELGDNLWANLGDNLVDNLVDNLRDNLRANLVANLGDNLRDNLRDNLVANLVANLRDNLRDNLEANLEANLWDNLWANLEANLWDNLRANLRANLGANLRDNLRDNLWANLWANLGANLVDNLGDNLKYQPTNLWGATDSYWIAHYLFPHQYLRQMHTDEQMQLLNLWADIARSAFWWYPYEGICFISNRPSEIHKDEEGRLHNENGPALLFRDTYAVHTLWGVNVTPEMMGYDPAQIMAVENAEQRMVLIKRAGLENMLGHLGTRTLDTRDDYELLMITIEGRECEFLKMINPTTREIHVEGVKPGITTVNEALAWRMGLDVFVNPVFTA